MKNSTFPSVLSPTGNIIIIQLLLNQTGGFSSPACFLQWLTRSSRKTSDAWRIPASSPSVASLPSNWYLEVYTTWLFLYFPKCIPLISDFLRTIKTAKKIEKCIVTHILKTIKPPQKHIIKTCKQLNHWAGRRGCQIKQKWCLPFHEEEEEMEEVFRVRYRFKSLFFLVYLWLFLFSLYAV